MPFAGKFGRVKVASTAVGYINSWRCRMRREPIDTTNFETTTDGTNVGEEQLTSTLGATFNVEGFVDTTAGINLFYPANQLTCDFLYRKTTALGFQSILCDVLGFEPGVQVKQGVTYTAEMKVNGLLGIAT